MIFLYVLDINFYKYTYIGLIYFLYIPSVFQLN